MSDQKNAGASPEAQALDAVLSEPSGALPGAPVPVVKSAEQQAQEDQAEAVAGNLALIDFACAMLEPVAPYIAKPFTPEKRGPIAAAWTQVEAKYGWSLADIFGKYGPEIALLMALGPPCVEAVKGYKLAKAYTDEKQSAAFADRAQGVEQKAPKPEPVAAPAVRELQPAP